MYSFSLVVQTSTIISLVMLALSLPALAAFAEYLLTRKISRLPLLLTGAIGVVTAGLFLVQVLGSKVVVTATGVELSSLMYTKVVDYKDIKSAVLIDESSTVGAPALWRKNGIGLPGYQVGGFASEYQRSIYLFRTSGPYIKLRLNDSKEVVIFSSTPEQYEVLDKYLSKAAG